MPEFYKIDKERRLVLTTGSGVFTLGTPFLTWTKLSKDPDFDPSFSQIADLTQVTRIELSADEIRRLAQRTIFSASSRRAFIAPDEVAFGIGRMFQILRGLEGEKGIRVFRSLEEALDWVFPRGATA
jgi:hypothetical protein